MNTLGKIVRDYRKNHGISMAKFYKKGGLILWIEKRKDKLIACERFRDETVGKNIKISVSINKDTPQERKKALKQLSDNWQKMHRNYSDLRLSEIGELYFSDEKERVKEQTLTAH